MVRCTLLLYSLGTAALPARLSLIVQGAGKVLPRCDEPLHLPAQGCSISVQPRTPFHTHAWQTTLPVDDNSDMPVVVDIDGVPTAIFPSEDELGVTVLNEDAELYTTARNSGKACLTSCPLTGTTATFLCYPLFCFQMGERCE